VPDSNNAADNSNDKTGNDQAGRNEPAKTSIVSNQDETVIDPPQTNCQPAKKHRDGYDKANLAILSLTFIAAVFAVIFSGAAWWIFWDQLEVTIYSQSPWVLLDSVSLLKSNSSEIKLLDNTGRDIDADVVVKFHNFGPRGALIRWLAIEWNVADKLPKEPNYAHERRYSNSIRPTGDDAKKLPIAVSDTENRLHLTKEQVVTITSGKSSLWVYGYVELEAFLGCRQKVRFCAHWDRHPPERFNESKDCPAEYERNPGKVCTE
jgi:hypothetical protein